MSDKFPSQKQDKFTVRFPDGMRDKIAEIAKKNNRSMNSEITLALEEYIKSKNKIDSTDSTSYSNKLFDFEKAVRDIEKAVRDIAIKFHETLGKDGINNLAKYGKIQAKQIKNKSKKEVKNNE